MIPMQQGPQPGQVPSPYRQNYHINPAQSKLVYRSPQNMLPAQIPNTGQQYPMFNIQMQNQQQKSTVQYQNQGSFVQSQQQIQQSQPQPLPPMNQAQYMPQQQFINQPNQNMIFTFQPMSPQPQRNVVQSEYNRSVQRPVSNNVVRSVPGPNQPNPQYNVVNQFPAQNMVPIVQSIPQSIQSQQKSQTNPNIAFNQMYNGQPSQPINSFMIQSQPQPQYQPQSQPQYQLQPQSQYQYQSQPQYQASTQPQYQAATQPQIPMVSSSKPNIQTSSVQVHMSTTVPNIGSTYNPVNIIPSENISIQKASMQEKGQILEEKIQSQFHMTNSVQVSHKGIQQQKKQQFVAQKVEETVQREIEENVEGGNTEDQGTDRLWEQRFVMIYQKFQWFYERYDFISRQFQVLSQEFQNVNSQDQWLQLKEKHDLLLQKIQQIQEELINTIHENQQLAEHYQLQNNTEKSSPEEQQVWEHRYHELLEQYKSLSQNYADLQTQNSEQQKSVSPAEPKGMSLEEQNQMQMKFHQLQNEYNILCEQYQKIRTQYERIYQENTHYNQQNNQLIANNQKTSTMAAQLQAYVEELQHQNDLLKKQQRKSTTSHQNCIPKDQAQKMHLHFTEQIQRYEEQLHKYRYTFEQYEEKIQLNRQQLQKISEIAMQRQNRIKQLQTQNTTKSGHSPSSVTNENQQMERRYVNILEQDVRIWRQKETQFIHKLQMKDMQKKSLQEKYHFLERQLQSKRSELDKISRNFDQKLIKIEQNTASNLQVQGLRQPLEEDSNRPTSSSQQQIQVYQLQSQLQELQNAFNTKLSTYKQLEEQIQNYEAQMRKQTNALSLTQMQYQKKISEIEIEMGKKVAEKDMRITVLNGQIERLNDVCENNNREKQSIRQTLKISLQQSERQLTQKYTQKVSQLQKKIQGLERQLEQKIGQINLGRELINRFEKEMKVKNQELIEMRNFITQMKKNSVPSHSSRSETQTLKEELRTKQEIIERKNDELSKVKRQKEYKIKYITQLEHQLQFVNSELNKRRSETSTLKRQLSDLQSLQTQYDILKSNMSKKVSEITQLKQDSYEMQKFRMLSESQSRDIQRLSQDNKDKQSSIQSLKQKVLQLQNYINKSITTTMNSNTYNASVSKTQSIDDSENKEYRELIKRKDSQISRLNQLLQENQYVIENKSRQLQTQKLQSGSVLRSKDSQISSLSHNLALMQTRVRQAQNKKQRMSEEVNELKLSFEEQLKSESERQKTYYDKVVSRHQEDYKQIKDKLRTAQQNYNLIQMELEKYKSNEKRLTLQLKELNNKLNEQNSLVLEKQELFSTFRLKQSQSEQSSKALFEKLSSLELQLKTKQQQLKLSQQKNTILEQKIKKNKKDYETFRNKLIVSQQYQNNNSVVEYLSKRIAQYESKMINQSERDFAFKVKNPDANHVFQNQVVYQLKIQNDMLRKQLQGKGIQYDRKILTQLEEENLKRSKNLLKNSTFSSKIGNVASQLLIKDNMEDVNFYKEKNKELQERVEKHLKVNKDLKQKIQALIKGNSAPKELQYYKEQISEYESKILQLERKIESLTEDNRTMSREISKKQSRVQEKYDQKVKDIEAKFTFANKQVQQLTQEKTQLQLTITKFQIQKTSLQQEIKRLNQKINLITKNQNSQSQQEIKTLQENCENYESQIAKLTNRCRFLEQEINRLNQTNSTNKQTLSQFNTLRTRVNELTQQMTKTLNDLHQSQLKTSSLTSQNVTLQTKLRTFQSQNQRLNEMIELYSKKQKTDLSESSVLKQSTSELQNQISYLQNQLTLLTSQREEQVIKVNEMLEKMGIYEELLRSLHYELQFIRSDVLLQQTLVEEISLGGDNCQQAINELRVNVDRKLHCLNQLFEKINRL